jgi:hypothetical protein
MNHAAPANPAYRMEMPNGQPVQTTGPNAVKLPDLPQGIFNSQFMQMQTSAPAPSAPPKPQPSGNSNRDDFFKDR